MNPPEPQRIYCVACRQPLVNIELEGTWGMCSNKDCPRVGLLSGVSLTVLPVQKKGVQDGTKDSKKSNK